MSNRWLRSLALSLGSLVAGGALAPAVRAETPAPNVQPYPAVAAALTESQAPPAASQPAAPAAAPAAEESPVVATLERPVALGDKSARVDGEVRPTGLFNNRVGNTIVYTPPAGALSARPMPIGTPVESTITLPAPSPAAPAASPYGNWQPPASATPAPTSTTTTLVPAPSGPLPTTVSPVPTTVTPLPAPTPLPAGAGVAGPIGNPVGDGYYPNACGAPACGAPACCDATCCAPGGCAMDCCGADCCGADGCGVCGGGWGCCGRCCDFGFGNRWWGSAEYLLWFVRGQPLPPLLTTGSLADNPTAALGQPGTVSLLGGNGNTLTNNPFSGVRLRAGYWFGPNHRLGAEIGGFILGPQTSRFSESSTGNPFLARPFFNALTGAQDIEAVATPNGLNGTFSAMSNTFIYGAEANLRSNLFCGPNWFFDGLAGWRLLGLNESLTMRENLNVVSSNNPNLPAGSSFIVTDRFATNNLFNGGQIGGIFGYRWGRWIADVRSTVAIGGVQEYVNISGTTVSQAPGQAATTSQGGLLAQTSNIGHYARDVVAVVPEVGVNIGYQFTPHIRGFVGYNFLYISSVVRPGNQIDPVVNPNLIPPATGGGGPQRPAFNFNGSDFWVQGINFGIALNW